MKIMIVEPYCAFVIFPCPIINKDNQRFNCFYERKASKLSIKDPQVSLSIIITKITFIFHYLYCKCIQTINMMRCDLTVYLNTRYLDRHRVDRLSLFLCTYNIHLIICGSFNNNS